jgi:CDP-glucose 4,6-dehydratase
MIAKGTAPNCESERLDSAFNFGPNLTSNRSVGDVVREVLLRWPGQMEDRSDPNALHEAGRLNLSIDKAFHLLGWKPVWNFAETVSQTVDWYRIHSEQLHPDPCITTRKQISDYVQRATDTKLSWAY